MSSNGSAPTSLQTAETDANFMKLAINLAKDAAERGEVPVGAVVVLDGEIVAQASNGKETSQLPTDHAELKAIEAAAQKLGRWRLSDCELYVTLEPCAMCAGAIVQARVRRLIYGARDPKAGAVESLFQIVTDPRLNHRAQVTAGVLTEDCSSLLTEFFRRRRSEK